MRNGDDHIVIGVHILGVKLRCHLHDLRTALISVFILNLNKFCVDEIVTQLLAGEQLVQMRNEFLNLLIFSLQLVDTQARERAQTHIYDSFGLEVI